MNPGKGLDAIVAVVAAQPEAVPVSAILGGRLPAELEKRTPQRRLALLVEQKRLIAEVVAAVVRA